MADELAQAIADLRVETRLLRDELEGSRDFWREQTVRMQRYFDGITERLNEQTAQIRANTAQIRANTAQLERDRAADRAMSEAHTQAILRLLDRWGDGPAGSSA